MFSVSLSATALMQCKGLIFRLSGFAGTGYVKTDDMRRIWHNLGLRLSYKQVKDLCTYVAEATGNTGSSRSSRGDRILYRQLTDRLVDEL